MRLELRYQIHKDALSEATRILQQFRHREDDEGNHYFDVQSVPLEIRQPLAWDLERLATHVRETHIPAELGDSELLRELVGTLERARAWAQGTIDPKIRREIRERFVDEMFTSLRDRIRGFDAQSFGAISDLRSIEYLLGITREALGWQVPGKRVGLAEAVNLIRTGEELLVQHRALLDDGEPD